MNQKHLQWLDDGILKIIDQFEYPCYQVSVDLNIDCVCKNFTTKQGEADCKRCLGTGQKIKIREIKAASQESSSSFRSEGMDEKGLATLYYAKAKYKLEEQDLIVDDEQVFVVHRIERKKGTNREYVYQKVIGINKKTDVKILIKNFNEIIGG